MKKYSFYHVMIILRIVFLLTLLSANKVALANALSAESLQSQEKRILTVAIAEVGYFPFNYIENGQVSGFSIEVLEYIERHSKYEYEFEFITTSWPRALHLVKHGKIDIILTLFKTEQRETDYHFIEPAYAEEVNQLFILSDRTLAFTGQLEQLSSLSIGTIREYSYGKAFDEASYLEKLPVLSEQVLLKFLLAGRIDIMIGNPLIFNKLIREYQLQSKIKAIEPYATMTPVYLALTKQIPGSQEIKLTLELLLEKLKMSKDYQQLLEKYQLDF